MGTVRFAGVVVPSLRFLERSNIVNKRWRTRTGPKCPKCAAWLTKRKSDMTMNCAKHGFVRNIMTPPSTYQHLKESAQ